MFMQAQATPTGGARLDAICAVALAAVAAMNGWGCGGAGPHVRPGFGPGEGGPGAGARTPGVTGEFRVLGTPDPRTGLSAYDSADLYAKGSEALSAGDTAGADYAFTRLLEDFPESRFAPLAHYHLGRGCAEAKRPACAAAHLAAFVGAGGHESLMAAARLMLGNALIDLGQAVEAIPVLEPLREHGGLEPEFKTEALARLGLAYLGAKRWDDAVSVLEDAADYYRRVGMADEARGNALVAEARFNIAEVYRLQFEGIALVAEGPESEKFLEDKARLLLKAQLGYAAAIRVGERAFAVAAAYRAGTLYDTFFEHFVAVPPPAGLTGDERAEYQRLLSDKVSVLLEKAIHIYERNLDMAQRIGVANDWVEMTRERMVQTQKRLVALRKAKEEI